VRVNVVMRLYKVVVGGCGGGGGVGGFVRGDSAVFTSLTWGCCGFAVVRGVSGRVVP
jgi:hypothetical protein